MAWRLQACVQTAVEGGDRLRQAYEAVWGATFEASVYSARFCELIGLGVLLPQFSSFSSSSCDPAQLYHTFGARPSVVIIP